MNIPRATSLAVLDAMISRAEAACERYQRQAEVVSLSPMTAGSRRRAWHSMEETLSRLREQRDEHAAATAPEPGAVAAARHLVQWVVLDASQSQHNRNQQRDTSQRQQHSTIASPCVSRGKLQARACERKGAGCGSPQRRWVSYHSSSHTSQPPLSTSTGTPAYATVSSALLAFTAP